MPGQQRPVIVGFAAETDDVLRHGREKLRRKGCDLLVVNEVGDGRGFAVDHNSAVVLVQRRLRGGRSPTSPRICWPTGCGISSRSDCEPRLAAFR